MGTFWGFVIDTHGYLLIFIGISMVLTRVCLNNNYYPTAPKGCRGIVFTHGVRMGGRAGGRPVGQVGGWREKVCPGCISETVRCRKLILGRDIGLGV